VTTTANPLVDRYLRDLRGALRGMPGRQRDELVAEISGHIGETLLPGASDAEVQAALERIGSPAEIAGAERERLGIAGYPVGWREWLAIVLILIGGVALPVLGWLIGLAFLWTSRAWTSRDKWLATLLVPGGLLPAVVLLLTPAAGESCTTGSRTDASGHLHSVTSCSGATSTELRMAAIVLFILLVVTPVITSVRLGRAAGNA
jgi:hypothetical protein